MENIVFSSQKTSFKENKMKRVILSKVSSVSKHNLQTIVEAIDIEQQYYVKATRNPKKFLNIVMHEDVCCDDKFVKSNSRMIYGECTPGMFIDHDGQREMVTGTINESKPAAAVKVVMNGPKEKAETILVIYEPRDEVLH